jgi:DDE family transposase
MHRADGTRVEVEVYAKRLTDVLGEEQVAAVARRSRWLRRARKVMPVMMVVAVLSTLGSGGAKWLADIHRTFRKFTGVKLQYKPFHKQLAKAAFAEMFRMLLEATVQRMTQPVLHAVSPNLSAFRDIVIHDGSSFSLKDELRRRWPGRFTKISPAAVELHVTMSLLKDDVRIVALTADDESERIYRPEAASLRERLFLADRGYEERRFFRDVQEAGGAFIVRGTKKIRPTILAAFDGAGKRIPKWAGKTLSCDLLGAHTVDLDIEWQLGSLVYRGRIVAIYKRGPCNRKTFVYLHTNLARDRFCAADVAGLYRLRWQVEILFKELKSHANLHAFDTGKAAIAEAMIWASLLAALLKRSIAHFAETSLGIELSTQRAAATGKHYFDDVLRGLLASTRRLRRALAAALDFLGANARRAHPDRDRKRGRLAMGLEPLALAR